MRHRFSCLWHSPLLLGTAMTEEKLRLIVLARDLEGFRRIHSMHQGKQFIDALRCIHIVFDVSQSQRQVSASEFMSQHYQQGILGLVTVLWIALLICATCMTNTTGCLLAIGGVGILQNVVG